MSCEPACRHQCPACRMGLLTHLPCDPRCTESEKPAHTPTTGEVRAMYITGTPVHRVTVTSGTAEFDRWLAEVRAETLNQAADEIQLEGETYAKTANILRGDVNTRYHAYAAARQGMAVSLRNRAAQYREGTP